MNKVNWDKSPTETGTRYLPIVNGNVLTPTDTYEKAQSYAEIEANRLLGKSKKTEIHMNIIVYQTVIWGTAYKAKEQDEPR